MRQILLVVVLISTLLNALDERSTLKVYDRLLSTLIPQKSPVYVYVNDIEYKNILQKEKRVVLVEHFKDADFILLTDESTLNHYKQYRYRQKLLAHPPIVFVTEYRFLEKCRDAVGALYWRKGRSQLLFIDSRLKRYHIVLPKPFKKFEVEAL